jgi:zinc protease
VRSAAERTLGVLPARRERLPFTERRVVQPLEKGLRMERAIDTEDDKSFVFLVFPTDDGIVTERSRALGFLADVVQDRLRILVREELGAAYSPGATSNTSTVFPGIGSLSISAEVDPEKVETFVEASLRVAKTLSEEGVGAEEVKRLAEPKLKEVRDSERRNGYWSAVLSEAQSRPESLDDARTREAFYRDLKPERISELAKSYLDPEKASILIVNPKASEEEGIESKPKEAGADQDD